MQLSALAKHIDGKLVGGDAEFFSVSTDTRTLAPGDLFIALQGPNFDGHHYLKAAFEKGACGALVSREVDVDKPVVQVADTLRGLGALARMWVQQFSLHKVAITGSCGKTTLKEMVAAILSQVGPTLATRGNLNNEIGVPLTLCRINSGHRFAVIECGANHVGEIAYTSSLVQPQVSIVNNVAPAHLEGFGSIENVAKAKGEIYDSLVAEGVAVINLDDGFAGQYQKQNAGRSQLAFSLRNKSADVYAEVLTPASSGRYQLRVRLPAGSVELQLPLPGAHNVRNALAACAIATALGVPASAMVAGLGSVKPAPGRLCPVDDIPGLHIIDDSYNANPASIRAAIDVLAEQGGASCLVLGGMAELGEQSASLHREIGRYAAERGVLGFYSLGPNAAFYQEGYEQIKPQGGVFTVCENHRQIADAIRQQESDKLILVKGSRSAAMEKVIHALRAGSHLNEENR